MSITYHMVMSLDGYIAQKDDDVSWTDSSWSPYPRGEELTEERVAEILGSIDCYVMGSKTYELALKLGWPYGDKPTIVVTSRKLTSDKKNVEFYGGDLPSLAGKLASKNAWLVGGPTLGSDFFRRGLVNKVCVTLAPVLLGAGVSFYGGDLRKLRLSETTAFKNGMLDLWYDVL